MPVGILGSLVICTALYAAFAIVLTGMVNYKQMHGDASPVATAIERTPFVWLQVTVKLGVILGFTSVILVGLLGQCRVMLAMAQDRMIPAVFARLHETRRTPWAAHLMMVLTAVLAGFVPVEALSRMTSIGTLLAFAIVCCGVLVLRVREPDRPRAFRVPGSPVVPGLGVAICLLMMVSLPGTTWLRRGSRWGWWFTQRIATAGHRQPGPRRSRRRRASIRKQRGRNRSAPWFQAPDMAAQKAIAVQIQQQAFQDVPYMPTGEYCQPTAYRKTLTGVLNGLPLMWNVKKEG